MRQINHAGIGLIKSFESCSLKSYQDLGGVWTIGWGHVHGVGPGLTCIQIQADQWLIDDVNEIVAIVDQILPQHLNSNQFSACVSLAFNVGTGNLQKSTLLKCLQTEDFKGASDQFLVWVKINGIPNDGLLRRRQAEQSLFNTPV